MSTRNKTISIEKLNNSIRHAITSAVCNYYDKDDNTKDIGVAVNHTTIQEFRYLVASIANKIYYYNTKKTKDSDNISIDVFMSRFCMDLNRPSFKKYFPYLNGFKHSLKVRANAYQYSNF